jgi:hypothetical protein
MEVIMQVAERERTSIYDDFLEFVIEKASPEAVLEFRLSEQAQERAIELLDRQDAAELTPAELDELKAMVRFNQIVSRLKARARIAMQQR